MCIQKPLESIQPSQPVIDASLPVQWEYQFFEASIELWSAHYLELRLSITFVV